MEDNNLTMADLMAEIDKTMKRIYRGDIKKATVVSVEDANIVLNIGYHADAILSWNEYSYDEVAKEDVQVGDTFDVQVVKIDDGDGNVLVSKRRAEAEVAYEKIEVMYKNKEHFTVKLNNAVKGGLLTSVQGVRAFVPGSQLTDTYVSDLSEYVGKTIEVEIIEFNPQAKKLVLSGKAIAKAKSEALRASRFEAIVEGDKYEGVVTKLMPYGAFVNIGGVEGLVHNSDLSWTRIKHPSDVVKEGDKVTVTVLGLDKEKGKISLGMKDVAMDPWFLETANLEVGQITTGTVGKFMSFGAFVKLSQNVEGLVHISQICEKRIAKPEEALELGQEVQVKIVNIDKTNKKIGLSMTEVKEEVDQDMQAFMAPEEDETLSTLGDIAGDAFKKLF
ncbi:MAG: 30S ribosomal protein S1 [Cellulosilyticaceae bacterium]